MTATVNTNIRYFSGSQASLYIGDVWVDEITSYSFTLQHDRSPVYGYGSQHWDFMPRGTIIIMGEFTINFKEPNYLWIILERYKRFKLAGSKRTKSESNALDDLGKKLQVRPESFESDTRRSLESFFRAKVKDVKDIQEAVRINTEGQLLQGKQKELMNHASFNMVLGYGASGKDSIGERINDIQIMQKTKTLQSDGRPITETYSFIARDMR
jgi:hypothetical protein